VTTATDSDRFLALVQEHKGILYKVANGYSRNREDRGDLIQETLVQIWRSYGGYDQSRCRFSTWMYRIAMNVAISFHRSEGRRIRDAVPLEDFGLDLAAADVAMDDVSDDARLLRGLISKLGELDRGLVLLYIDGHTHDEIAEILGITATNASTRLGRIKERLEREFDAAEKGAGP
jgi:RNA polymerase sigma factor (sigma-70 family)